MSTFSKTVYFFVTGLVFITFSACLSKQKPESNNDAISLAEDFIKRNGYTKFEADKNNFEFESSDNLIEQNIPATLKKRYNTLQPNAFCILKSDWAWHVGFLRTGVEVNNLDSLTLMSDLPGRAVNVYSSGEIRMSGKEPAFSNFIKLQ